MWQNLNFTIKSKLNYISEIHKSDFDKTQIVLKPIIQYIGKYIVVDTYFIWSCANRIELIWGWDKYLGIYFDEVWGGGGGGHLSLTQ